MIMSDMTDDVLSSHSTIPESGSPRCDSNGDQSPGQFCMDTKNLARSVILSHSRRRSSLPANSSMPEIVVKKLHSGSVDLPIVSMWKSASFFNSSGRSVSSTTSNKRKIRSEDNIDFSITWEVVFHVVMAIGILVTVVRMALHGTPGVVVEGQSSWSTSQGPVPNSG